jgi:hypothetical protein
MIDSVAGATLAVMLLVSCSSDNPSVGSPSLLALDTVLLVETDSLFVGQPTGFAAAEDGTYLIADLRNATVHHYAPDGRHLGRLGQRGRGPSEFASGPGVAIATGDSLVIVHDGVVAKLLNYRTGALRWERLLPGSAIPRSEPLASRNGRYFFRLIDRAQRTTLAVVSGASDPPLLGGPFPDLLGWSRIVDDHLSYLQVAPLAGDSVAVAVEVADAVFTGPFGGPYRRTEVPVQRRRGSRPDLVRQVQDSDPQRALSVVYELSVPYALGRLSSGNLAYVTADLTRLSNRFAVRLFVSVVDPARQQACTDAEIQTPTDPRPP